MEELLQLLGTECGVVDTLLLVILGISGVMIKILWNTNKSLDKEMKGLYGDLLEVVKNNTEVMTKLVDRVDDHDKRD
jgi:hypothetical protein